MTIVSKSVCHGMRPKEHLCSLKQQSRIAKLVSRLSYRETAELLNDDVFYNTASAPYNHTTLKNRSVLLGEKTCASYGAVASKILEGHGINPATGIIDGRKGLSSEGIIRQKQYRLAPTEADSLQESLNFGKNDLRFCVKNRD